MLKNRIDLSAKEYADFVKMVGWMISNAIKDGESSAFAYGSRADAYIIRGKKWFFWPFFAHTIDIPGVTDVLLREGYRVSSRYSEYDDQIRIDIFW